MSNKERSHHYYQSLAKEFRRLKSNNLLRLLLHVEVIYIVLLFLNPGSVQNSKKVVVRWRSGHYGGCDTTCHSLCSNF